MRPYIFRISTSAAGLAIDTFAAWEIPLPSVIDYRDHVTSLTRGDASQIRKGYRQLNMTWDTMSALQWHTLLRIVRDVDVGQIYLTVDLQNGNQPGEYYIDVSGYPHRPTTVTHGQSVVGRRGGPYSFANVTLLVNNIAVVNNPSIYTPN